MVSTNLNIFHQRAKQKNSKGSRIGKTKIAIDNRK